MTGASRFAVPLVLLVPVRRGAAGAVVRLFRTALGAPTAVGFSSAANLTTVLGPDQPWIELTESALRAMVGPLGGTGLVVDPTMAAPVPAPRSPVDSLPAPRRVPMQVTA